MAAMILQRHPAVCGVLVVTKDAVCGVSAGRDFPDFLHSGEGRILRVAPGFDESQKLGNLDRTREDGGG